MLLKTAFTALSLLAATVSGTIVKYTRPPIFVKSDVFEVKINGSGLATVSYERYDYVQWSMSEGPLTEVRIKAWRQKSISSWSITPAKLGIQATIQGNELVFSMKKAHYLIIKIDDLKEFVALSDPLETDVPSLSSASTFNAADYGADNTGKNLTHGIQKALDAAGKKPGSVVFVGPGLYLSGNIVIPTQTSLYLHGDAVLHFTGHKADYKVLYKKPDLVEGTWWISTAKDSTGIKLYGRGTIDGNGHYTRSQKFMASLVVPSGTTGFVMDGPLVRESSFWSVNVVQVTNALIKNVKILNRFDVTQDDGIDINESSHVTVRHVISIANDDSFSVKTWREETETSAPYPYAPRIIDDVVFDDCLAWTLCFAYKIGEGVWQEQRNIVFKNSHVYKAGVGLSVHHKFGSKAVRNVTWQNIYIEELHGAPAGQAAWGTWWVNDVNLGIGPIQNLLIKDIYAKRVGSRKGLLEGKSDQAKISGVTFTNIYFGGKKANTLQEMNLNPTKFYENIQVKNT
ncbi:pectin lyase-like protein [Auricularia subglabra TFB-10046 SS5]|nr:pectin lyase-like protein [Auricularia subglabra TFB-10046 SS5]